MVCRIIIFFLISASHFVCFGQVTTTEQMALDSTLRYTKKSHNVKKIELDTTSENRLTYWAMHMSGCFQEDQKLRDTLIKNYNIPSSRKLTLELGKIKTIRYPRFRENSAIPKINVFTSYQVDDYKYVLVTLYKKKEFVEYHFFSFNKEDNLVDHCISYEII